ncbi:hypothetical protein WI36_22680 [Burkholderia ubonensis]|nr:hypothetical protein WI36_22680 [Burkholderia ubonensis]
MCRGARVGAYVDAGFVAGLDSGFDAAMRDAATAMPRNRSGDCAQCIDAAAMGGTRTEHV